MEVEAQHGKDQGDGVYTLYTNCHLDLSHILYKIGGV